LQEIRLKEHEKSILRQFIGKWVRKWGGGLHIIIDFPNDI
jgi:hypothetical protein